MTDAVVARIERVTHRYGKTFALNDLTLDIPARCMVGMIGPDGVGKSTLLGLVPGGRKTQPGKVSGLGGHMADAPARRASFGRFPYMPQGLGRILYPALSVTLPVWILRTPETRPSKVDLPTPSGPIIPTMHRAGISRVRSLSANVLP